MGIWGTRILSAAAVLALQTASTNATAADPSVPLGSTARVDHYGEMMLQIEATPAQVDALGLDVWTHRAALPLVLARVSPEQWAALDASGYAYTIVEPDLGRQVDAEVERLGTVVGPVAGGGLDPNFSDDYRPLDTVLAQLDALAATYPERVSIIEVGTSLEGRPIRGVRITNPGAEGRPVVVAQACQHAREWITVAASMYAAQRYAETESGSALDSLLDETELIIVPIVNPDGYVYTWDVDRLWRKNRRDDHGVDLNRNWSVGWGGDGSSGILEENNYRGTAAFSEPETTAMRDLMTAETNAIAMLDIHAFGQLLLYPWGFGFVDSELDMLFADMTQDMSDAMYAPNSLWYQPLQSADFYPAAGNSIDWAYGVHGLYGVAIELRPGFENEQGFLLGPGQIVPTGQELVAGIAELMVSSVDLGPAEPGDSGGPVEDSGDDQSTTSATAEGGETFGDDDDTTGDGDDNGGSGAVTSGPPPGGTAGPGPDDSAGDEGSDEGTDDGGAVDSDQGCGCTTGSPHGGAWWLALGILALVRRRQ